MTLEETLDRILVPRPNGSSGLEEVGTFIAERLQSLGLEVDVVPFSGTPGGFALLWGIVLILMLACAIAIVGRYYRIAFALVVAVPLLLVAETELLWQPLTAFVAAPGVNIAGTFPGPPDAPLLILSAHYDTATNFGDHFDWFRWGFSLGPALFVAAVFCIWNLRRRKRGRDLLVVRALVAGLVLAPFAAMAWFFAAGPVLRTPSPGALDNGGAVAVLLQLGERLVAEPAAGISVRLLFLASEEERALGSWHYASSLAGGRSVAVVNLETVGGEGRLAYVPEEGFQFRRFPASAALIDLVQASARDLWGTTLARNPLPAGVITDARSFLAQGIPALTLVSETPDGFARGLHSQSDDRHRLSMDAIVRTVDLLEAAVRRVRPDSL